MSTLDPVDTPAHAVRAHMDGSDGHPSVYVTTPGVTLHLIHDTSRLSPTEAAAQDVKAAEQVESLIAVLLDFLYAIRGDTA